MEGKTVSDYTLNTKCVQAGYTPAYSVVPVETKRCVVKLDEKKAAKKTARWQYLPIFRVLLRIKVNIIL